MNRKYIALLMLLLASISLAEKISIDKTEATFCPSSTQIFKLTIENQQGTDKAIHISMNGEASTWATLSREKISIPANSKEQVTLFVTAPPLIKKGDYKLDIEAAGGKLELIFHVADCFKLALDTPETFSVCPGDSYTLSGKIRNNGKITETIELVGTDFSEIEPFAVNLKPSEEEEFAILLGVPDDLSVGIHKITVSAGSQTSYATAEKEINIEVLDCYNMEASVPAYIETCINEESIIKVNVTNIGVSPGVVSVNTSADAKVINDLFYLKEGDSQVSEIRTTQTKKGQKTIEIEIDYGKGKISKNITLLNKDCNEFSTETKISEFICPCQSGFLEVTVNNLGKYSDNFTIEMEGISDDVQERTIDASAKDTIKFQIDIPCENKGNLPIRITTSNSKYKQEKTVSLEVPETQECYNTTVEISPANISLAKGKGGLFTVTINNFGMMITRYVLEAAGANWAYIDPENITIGPDQKAEAYLYVSPVYGTEPGTYPVSLVVSGERVYTGGTVEVIVTNETYIPEYTNETAGTAFVIFGTKNLGYGLAGVGILLILVILYLVIWDSSTKKEITEEPERKEVVMLAEKAKEEIASIKEAVEKKEAKEPEKKEPDLKKEEPEKEEGVEKGANAGDVKFSEVIHTAKESEFDNEMVKIHNIRDTSIDISNWTLSDGEGTYQVPANTIIPAKGYWTVYGSTYNPEQDKKGLSLTDKHDYVVLLDSNRKIIDKYAW